MKLRLIGVLLLCTAALASCTNPLAKKDDFQEVVRSHGEALAKSILPESFERFSGSSHFDGKIVARGQRESLNLAITADSKEHEGNSSLSLGFDGNLGTGTTQSGVNVKWAVDAILASGTGYINIRSFQISWLQDGGRMSGTVNALMDQYGRKWIRLPHSGTVGMPSPQPNIEAARAAFAKHPVFAMSKDLGYSDGAYHYEVTLDKAQMLELHKELKLALTGTGMDSAEIAETKNGIDAMDLQWVLTVEDGDREYGSFSGTFTRKEPMVAEGTWAVQQNVSTGTISYYNTSDAFHFEIASGQKFVIDLKKELTKVSGTVLLTDENGHGAPIRFSVEKTLSGYDVNVSTDMDIPTGEKVNLTAEGKLEIQKGDGAKIEAPAQSVDLESILWGMGLMAPPSDPGDEVGTWAADSIDEQAIFPPTPDDADIKKLENEAAKLEKDANIQLNVR